MQIGPTLEIPKGFNLKRICGFAALSNALNIYNLNSFNLNELVELGRSNGITNFGELFSVDWLFNFINKYWPNLNLKIGSEMDCSLIIKHFLKGENEKKQYKKGVLSLTFTLSFLMFYFCRIISTILIPYDCDRGNFEPCNRNGVGAHWAILTGFIFLSNKENNSNCKDNNKIIKLIDSNEFLMDENLNEDCLYLIAYQGKSSHPAIWPFPILFQSNAQLNIPTTTTECQNNNGNNKTNFCLPPEGINISLRGKCLLLNGRKKNK
ncbi:hypothetical protein Mgra_00007340 [Meloidogyne graminicola]|uniref:Actin maturation protease n=1 Tax=Meloidogyne graminicola TaxID=189291 RepID=A0A8S9ZIT5_9BILA|nr:hypothetical protein Mgra_00007340 [Meloidogyne graminicola]